MIVLILALVVQPDVQGGSKDVFLIKNKSTLKYPGRDQTDMSDLSLLNKPFECCLMLCRSESIIKKDKIFKVCEKICLLG